MNSGGSDEDDMETPAAYEEMETPTGGGRNAVSVRNFGGRESASLEPDFQSQRLG